ncbi:dual specificity protein phosphatase 3-like [Amphiura filiformis]|uniref:dual specificity protein phosphatase 3-like n=1 Tax=Amphiura filiformis TaxID=82378 RepID=UPI003B225621
MTEKHEQDSVNSPATPWRLMEIILDKENQFDVPYSMCHEVYPNIIIGGKTPARNKSMLVDLGITHIVNCAQGDAYGFVNTDQHYYQDVGFQFYAIKARDQIGFSILPYLKPTADYIHQALLSGGKVFVHCCSGYSRAPTVVISYLMHHKHMDVRDALTQVRSKRRVAPNASFREQLCELNAELFSNK